MHWSAFSLDSRPIDLTHDEAWIGIAQHLKAAHSVGESVREVTDKVDDRVARVDDRVARVDDRVVDDRVAEHHVGELLNSPLVSIRALADQKENDASTPSKLQASTSVQMGFRNVRPMRMLLDQFLDTKCKTYRDATNIPTTA